jgi:hypothetical protein
MYVNITWVDHSLVKKEIMVIIFGNLSVVLGESMVKYIEKFIKKNIKLQRR